MRSLGRTSRLILTVLAKEPAHGYAVISWTKEMSGGTEQLAVGSVYGALEKLEQQGHIEHDHDEIEQGRTRRCFRITPAGRDALVAEVTRLDAEVKKAQESLGIDLGGLKGATA